MGPRLGRIFGIAGIAVAAGALTASAMTGADFLTQAVPAAGSALAAGVGRAGNADAVSLNPAGLDGTGQGLISFTHFVSVADVAYDEIRGLYPGVGSGTLGARLMLGKVYNFTQFGASGAEEGVVDNQDLLLSLAYGLPLDRNLSAGIAVKAFESTLAGYKSQGGALDFGLQYQLAGLPLRLGAALLNLGRKTAFAEEVESLPLMAAVGASFRLAGGGVHSLEVSGDWNDPLAQDLPGWMSVGAEYAFEGNLFLRGGYRFSDSLGKVSLGAGIRLYGLQLDYAFQPLAELGTNHRVTVSYAFQGPGLHQEASADPVFLP